MRKEGKMNEVITKFKTFIQQDQSGELKLKLRPRIDIDLHNFYVEILLRNWAAENVVPSAEIYEI